MNRVQFVAFILLGHCVSLASAQDDIYQPPAAEVERKLQEQFVEHLYPLLADADSGCIDCHTSQSTSALVLSGDATGDFWQLLDGGYLAPRGPDTLLGRIASTHAQRRMPKDQPAWSDDQLNRLQELVSAVAEMERQTGKRADERFPRSLLTEYHGPRGRPLDNQFITYRQLRGKIEAIFEDRWQRGERDYFAENIALFGGADFENRFNESAAPTPAFLSGLEMLARDVAQHAYRQQTGPFENWAEPQTPPDAHEQCIAPGYEQAIAQLYDAILFRAPTPQEVTAAYELLAGVHRLDEQISQRDCELVFELTVDDPLTQHKRTRQIHIPIHGSGPPVHQWLVDQRPAAAPSEHKIHQAVFRPVISQLVDRALRNEDPIARFFLGDSIYLKADATEQRLVIHNAGTHRNVSFAGVEILDLQGDVVSIIDADDPQVQVDGAWKLDDDDRVKSFEDGNQHKGQSSITVPLQVPNAGAYCVILKWRASDKNADRVLVEVYSDRAENRLVHPQPLVIPPHGEAQFFYDCSLDTVPFIEFDGAFELDADSYIEISNQGTLDTVTAGAVELVSVADRSQSILLDSAQADGQQDWQRFDEGRFRAYNVKGLKLHDDNRNKGELSLQFRLGQNAGREDGDSDSSGDDSRSAPVPVPVPVPVAVPVPVPVAESRESTQGLSSAAGESGTAYDIRVYYPGKREQESRVPVVVRAASSAPIIQVSHPLIAKADARVRLDASSSYTVQGSQLKFSWRQLSGPLVELSDAEAAVVEFQAPRLDVRQVAWSGLCAALLRHPDFLFTRAPSLASAPPDDRSRLILNRLTLDLLGRAPTSEEFAQLKSGKSIAAIVDEFLDSSEFRDFYFHRIRLYLESQGGAVQDEPARLWSYIAFEDRPFQEILTADYTVDANFQRVSRPEYHGHTGVLTCLGFIDGKPGLPHYNYAAQVAMLFLGYVFEVPPEIVEQREGVTALGTTDPTSNCYSCHKILTPLAFQRSNWTDFGEFRTQDDSGLEIDATDRAAAEDYPFPGDGLEAFATQAVKKERFVRTIINTHVGFFFGRPLRLHEDERGFYKRLWDHVHAHDFKLRELIRAIVTSDEYLRPSAESLAFDPPANHHPLE